MKLTLNEISTEKLCKIGWGELLKSVGKTGTNEVEISINHLLESNGIDDILWVILNCMNGQLEKKKEMVHEIAKLAIEPAKSVLYIFEEVYPDDDRPRKAIEAAENYFNDSTDTCADAVRAAYIAAYAAYDDADYVADFIASDDNDDTCSIINDNINFTRAVAYASKSAVDAINATICAIETCYFVADYVDSAVWDAFYAVATLNDFYKIDDRDHAHKIIREKQKEIILKYFGESNEQ